MSFDKQAKNFELLKIEFSKEHAQFLLDMTPNWFILFYFIFLFPIFCLSLRHEGNWLVSDLQPCCDWTILQTWL